MKPLNHAFSGYATTIFEVCEVQLCLDMQQLDAAHTACTAASQDTLAGLESAGPVLDLF
jgi:hypothetical protein